VKACDGFDLDVADPAEYDSFWASTLRVDDHHDLADMCAILDRPQLFDVINLHNPGDSYEIEHRVKWLAYETGKRGYTNRSSSATRCPRRTRAGGAAVWRGIGLAVFTSPAKDEDRCRLADFLTKMVNRDKPTEAWTRGFVAS
jgi:hypothetical protein